jgi:hypothetical protein
MYSMDSLDERSSQPKRRAECVTQPKELMGTKSTNFLPNQKIADITPIAGGTISPISLQKNALVRSEDGV